MSATLLKRPCIFYDLISEEEKNIYQWNATDMIQYRLKKRENILFRKTSSIDTSTCRLPVCIARGKLVSFTLRFRNHSGIGPFPTTFNCPFFFFSEVESFGNSFVNSRNSG